MAEYGEAGEKNIAYELKNSGMDMYILHDIFLEFGDLSAQIDYIVLTRQSVYIIECKNLIGNIEIDNTGSFVRTYEIMGKKVKEGIYSPITQNERHAMVLKEIRKNSKKGMFSKVIFESAFNVHYKPIVVLANPKTYLNAKFAKKEIKDKVIRADQLISYIKKSDAESQNKIISKDEMRELAEFYLNCNQSKKSDYSRKYEEMLNEIEANSKEKEVQVVKVSEGKELSSDKEELVSKLKEFRLEQSRKENIKPYYIFNNEQMEDLIEKRPQTKEELLKISGFGDVKVAKYGEMILELLK